MWIKKKTMEVSNIEFGWTCFYGKYKIEWEVCMLEY